VRRHSPELALRFDVDEDAKSDTPVDSLQEIWAQPQAPYPLDGIGFLSGDIYDLQGRFNINGLVDQSNNQGRDPNTPLGAAPAQPVGETGGNSSLQCGATRVVKTVTRN
jgi:hypothetical protein